MGLSGMELSAMELGGAEPTMLKGEAINYDVQGRRILDCVDIAVAPRDFLGFIGPNGAGKTSLIRVLAGLAAPSHGRVLFEGRPLASLSEKSRAQQMAFMSQSPQIGFGFTVFDVVSMGRYPYRRRLQSLTPADHRVVDEAMAATGVTGFRNRRVTELSGGERQRVFLARALAQEPRLFFLDEPTANLDVRYQLEILSLVRRLNEEKGLTVIMAVHDLTWALRYCSRILALHQGRVVADGPTCKTLTEGLLREIFGVEGRIVQEAGRPPRVDFADESRMRR